MPAKWTPDLVEDAGARFAELLEAGHKALCPWRSARCAAALAAPPALTQEGALAAFAARLRRLRAVPPAAVPRLAPAAVHEMDERAEGRVERLLAREAEVLAALPEHVGDGKAAASSSAPSVGRGDGAETVIALCEWDAEEVQPGAWALACRGCGAKVGLWNFRDRPGAEEAGENQRRREALERISGPLYEPCWTAASVKSAARLTPVAAGLAQTIAGGPAPAAASPPPSVSIFRSPFRPALLPAAGPSAAKRPREADESPPSRRKAARLGAARFDPLGSHRAGCPCVASATWLQTVQALVFQAGLETAHEGGLAGGKKDVLEALKLVQGL